MVRIVKKAHERREEIIIATCNLFLSKGYANTTMLDVMEEVQIAKGTIYHYFKSKDELLGAVVDYIVEGDLANLREVLQNASGSSLDKMELVIRSNFRHILARNISDQLHHTSNSEMHLRLIAATVIKQGPLYAELIRQGCEEGIFFTDSPLDCAEFIMIGLKFFTDRDIFPWSKEQLLRRNRAIPSLIESLLNAPKGSFQFLVEIEF